MRKIIVCLLAFALLLSLAACGEPAPEESGWAYAYNQKGAFSDQGYYFLAQGSFLRFTDFSSGNTVTLCSKAGCLHDDETSGTKRESCEAYIWGQLSITPLFFWNDSIYYILGDEYGAQVYRRDAVGTGLQHVATLGKKFIDQQKSVTMYAYALSGGYLYYDADVNGQVLDGYGGSTVDLERIYVGRVDLKTGKEDILYENTEEDVYLCGAKDDSFLIRVCARNNIDRDDPDRREKWLAMPASLRRWDGETGKVTPLFETTIKELNQVTLVDGRTLYYMTLGDSGYITYAYDIGSGKTKKVCDTSIKHLGGGYGLRQDNETKQWALINLATGKELPNELTEYHMFMQTISEKGVVFYQLIDEPEKERSEYAYVTYEDMADGLQKSDLLTFYTRYMG